MGSVRIPPEWEDPMTLFEQRTPAHIYVRVDVDIGRLDVPLAGSSRVAFKRGIETWRVAVIDSSALGDIFSLEGKRLAEWTLARDVEAQEMIRRIALAWPELDTVVPPCIRAGSLLVFAAGQFKRWRGYARSIVDNAGP